MAASYWLDRSSKDNSKTYDVVILGAGISGLSSAYWLKQEDPSLNVAIIEKHRLSYGATGRNAGFVTCGSVEHFNRMISKHGEKQALEIWRFAETNMALLKEHIIQDNANSIEFEQRGAYSLAAQIAEFDELKKVAAIMDKHKIPNQVVQSEEIEKNLGATEFVGGIKYVKDGAINPVKLNELIGQSINADIFIETEAYRVDMNQGGNCVIKTDAGDFESPIIISCLNGYSANLFDYFKNKIYPTRGQMLMTEPIDFKMDGPCYANFYLDYFRQMPNGKLLIGGFRQLEKETEVGYSDHVTEVIQDALHSFIQKHLPRFKEKQITHRWAGIMGFSKDGEPMVGSLPENRQVFFCGGYTGHGIGLAFHMAKQTVDAIFGKEIPNWINAGRFN